MGREENIFDSYLNPPEPEDPGAYENKWCALEDIQYDEMMEERMCRNG